MSQLIDPGLFKDTGEEEGGVEPGARPFASPYAEARPSGAGFKDPRVLTRVMIAALGLDLAATAIFIFGLASGAAAPTVIFDGGPFHQALIFIGGSLTWIGWGRLIIMLMWFYRANKNARALSSGLEITPGWAVGFFFIPIMSLYKPYQAISEIWRSAASPYGWKGLDDPAIIRWWWGLYLVSAIVPLVVAMMAGEGGSDLGFLALLPGMAENICFLIIVRFVAGRQWEARSESVFD
ncbi:MAG: DUF4328 domain-containing protein [Caulobacter sp.]|nr:DUF4328 domain-containing protein [Caulobacter sp.]